jgi:predicted RNA binding protein YcfA (HicA-like mRNA interferase family)
LFRRLRPAESGYFWSTEGATPKRFRHIGGYGPQPMKGTLSQKKAIKLLKEDGWTQARGGKHQVKMTKPGCRPITLPQHKGRDYQPGLTSASSQAGGPTMKELHLWS